MSASPTAPSAAGPGSLLGLTSVAPGGIPGTYDVDFPPRNDSFDFRNQLEVKYATGLGRAATSTYVDREGEVVWTQEYMRYRVNGCDHSSAVQRVLSQIDGNAAGAVCGSPAEGLIAFPPRTEAFDFRRQLESKYQQLGRGFSSSAVDAEGGVVWTQEYLRYRVNACDHATSVQKVFTQVDGGAVPATCYVPPCIFTVSPTTQAVAQAGGTLTAVIAKTSGEDCTFRAESLEPWIAVGNGSTGSAASTTLTYTVGPNFGNARSGFIRIRWSNTSTLMQIDQAAGTNVAFTMTDPNASPNPTTTCAIRTASTPCQFAVTGSFSSTATFTWHVEYEYGRSISHDFSSTTPTFAFTQACGGSGATAGGTTVPLKVWLTVTDGLSSVNIQSEQGAQPPLSITFFTCSI